MARISNTKGIKEIGGSQFELIMAAAGRARSYDAANPPLVSHVNKRGMTALREIEAGLVDVEANRKLMVDKYRTVFPKDLDADTII